MFLKDEMSQTARNAHSDEAHAGAGDASFSFRFYAQKLAKSYILIIFSNQIAQFIRTVHGMLPPPFSLLECVC